ncbi:MAG: AAA family ATPase [Candidatus Sericytochromatia bacterium]|nr:AAA family ATPase [Candidatus Tanganyikabacteria bacterium]
MAGFRELLSGMKAGRSWDAIGDTDRVRDLLDGVYAERYHSGAHHRNRYQTRVNLQRKDDAASYAGWITAENTTSGPYQGTSFVWFPGEGGSVAVLVVGTDGFGADAQILGRPGHARRLRALSRIHGGRIWVKPDALDLGMRVPETVVEKWPEIGSALKSYGHVIYAAAVVDGGSDDQAVEDLLDLFFYEHGTPLTGSSKDRWQERLGDIANAVFPKVSADQAFDLLCERRLLVLEGPPGTGKTRMAKQICDRIGSATTVQFHPARTYEDFVVGLYPQPASDGLKFEVRAGDLLVANEKARKGRHVLLIDEINRADLARVLGEALMLFEPGEPLRTVRLPHTPAGHGSELQLSPDLLVLATRNTADRTIARLDIAIRRRFAFLPLWPDLDAVRGEEVEFAIDLFEDTVHTFANFADEETLRLIPGHAYFLDPRPELGVEGRDLRVANRLRFELLPLLRDYLEERLCGGSTMHVANLADRVEARLLGLTGKPGLAPGVTHSQ